jgi:hypothetical protein
MLIGTGLRKPPHKRSGVASIHSQFDTRSSCRLTRCVNGGAARRLLHAGEGGNTRDNRPGLRAFTP